MPAGLNQSGSRSDVRLQPFVAVDVGGTHARVGLVQAQPEGGTGLDVLAYRTFRCADFDGLGKLLAAFLERDVHQPVRRCVVACAGQRVGDRIVHDNLAWPIHPRALCGELGLEDVSVLNDFEALGHALDGTLACTGRLLCGPDVHRAGPTLVVGPGTGLGAAVHLTAPEGGGVLTTEAGQADFAPNTVREREILAYLAPQGGYVPWERVVSGPGILTLYAALCHMRGAAPELATPEAVTAAAAAGTDPHAVEAVAIFCATLGSFVGGLAMTFMATGGIYLAGGFLYSMFDLLQRSAFEERFLHGRSVRAALARMPVWVVDHGRYGMLGAARWYLQRLRAGAWATAAPLELAV